MKKILSVMLAIMMLFGAMSINVSAAEETYTPGVVTNNNVVIVFEFGSGKSKKDLPVFDGVDFVMTPEVTGTYKMLPGAYGKKLVNKDSIQLPSVSAPEGYDFVGWQCDVTGRDYVAGANFVLTDYIIADAHNINGGVIYMYAIYEVAEYEEDTMATVLNVLMKVFGTIVGILFLDGNSAAGVELMQSVLGGLLG